METILTIITVINLASLYGNYVLMCRITRAHESLIKSATEFRQICAETVQALEGSQK